MKAFPGDYYVVNNQKFPFKDQLPEWRQDFIIYEVIRIQNSGIAFWSDHLQRFKNSSLTLNQANIFDENLVRSAVELLIKSNNTTMGNIRILATANSSIFEVAAYCTSYQYPEPELYNQGILLTTFHVERPNPSVKHIGINQLVKQKIEQQKGNTGAYEVLLVNNNQEITEGSASNFFLIKKNRLYSAPFNSILPGITRKNLLNICSNLKIPVKEERLYLNRLSEFEAALICGTSPKILPVRQINEVNFQVDHALLRQLISEFEKVFLNGLEYPK